MKTRRLSLILSLVFSLISCEITPKQPALHDFGLSPSTYGIKNEATPSIEIEAPKWVWDNRIRYRLLFKTPTKVNFYMLDKWIAPPPELFQQQLRLRGKFLYAPLVIEFLDFEQQFATPQQAKVIMHFTVTAFSSDKKQTLANKEFYFQHVSQTPDAKGAVEGFAILVNQAINEMDNWLAGLK